MRRGGSWRLGRYARVATVAALAGVVVAAPPAAARSLDGVTSSNVEHVRNIPINGGATSAAVVGNRLYVVGFSTLAIFDISDPADPVRLSAVPLGLQFPNEDVDTNGKVLVLAETSLAGPSLQGKFHVWDVRDPANPREVATVASTKGDRSLTCVYDCTYAYGSSGTILDLADPAKPQVVGDWGTGKPVGRGFDVTEVSPGLILTSTRPLMLLDARENPLTPVLRATGEDTARTAHFAQWPQRGEDRFMLSSVETFGKPRCDSASGPLITLDAATAATGKIRIVDEFRLSNGTVQDGRPFVNKLACSAHVFDAHGGFRNGGLVALGHFDHGTRFVRVDGSGRMSEVGYFMPYSGQTFSARWATDEVVYGIDLERGIDVLRMRVAPDCSNLTASPTSLSPPDGTFRTVQVGGADDADFGPVSHRVTAVTQDEPVGATAPDARPAGAADAVELRAERDGNGDGRVYRLGVTATNAVGAKCTSTVRVAVPHDASGRRPAVDSGGSHDSCGGPG
ncbi:MAG: hypothetical protein M3P50_05030 [Actinomycetota bacterium]|nr:hypothetical protein [Actinomycetota bacterium]